MSHAPERTRVDRARLPQAVTIAARAFYTDPFLSWMFPEAQRRALVQATMNAMIATRHHVDGVFLDRDVQAQGMVALEFPGRAASALIEARHFAAGFARIVPELLYAREKGALLGRIRTGLTALQLMHLRRPRQPHMYVSVLAVDPTAQRTGVGGRLLRSVVADADRTGAAAHLETARPENVGYYERFGFVVRDEIRLRDAPPMWIMSRAVSR